MLIKQYDLEDRVSVFPNLSLSEKVSFLNKAKVYLHTMKFEDFGISIVEGMAASCIPVVHNSGGPIEFVPKEWLYDHYEDASQKIDEALIRWTPQVGSNIQQLARQFHVSHFIQKFSTYLKEYLISLNH